MQDFKASVVIKLNDQFSRPAQEAKTAWANLKAGVERSQVIGAKMADIGKKATIGFTVPVVAAGAAAIKAGVAFNKGLANVASLGVAEARVRSLGGSVQAMAVQFGQSTASLNEGLYQVVSAYGDTADTAQILEINTKAAAAGLATTSEAIALTSAVTKGYGDTSAAAIKRTADLAFQTIKLGQTTLPELASSMGKVTGNANALGVSQEDLFAVFATTTGVVGSAAEVSTSTAAILTEMIKPGRELAGAIAGLGYSSSDAMIAQLGFGGAIQALGGYAQNSGKKITNLFSSSEAGKVAMSIAGAQADVFNNKLKEMEQSTGALNAAYAAQTGGINQLGFQYEQLKTQVAVSSQNIGQALMPALRVVLQVAMPVAQSIGAVANTFSALSQPVQNSVLALVGVAVAAGPVLSVVGSILTVGPLVVGVVAAVGVAIALLVAHWDSITAALGRAWGWFSKLLDNPLIATADVVFSLFIAVPALIVKHWGKVKDFFRTLFGGIAAGWGKVKGLFSWLPGMGKKSGAALTATVAEGMTGAKPQMERAAYGVAYAADQYLPHSNAKKGPLSGLSDSGQALVDTLVQGAETRNLNLGGALALPGAPARGAADGGGQTTINIENLTVQAEGIENALDFVRALQHAGGWRISA